MIRIYLIIFIFVVVIGLLIYGSLKQRRAARPKKVKPVTPKDYAAIAVAQREYLDRQVESLMDIVDEHERMLLNGGYEKGGKLEDTLEIKKPKKFNIWVLTSKKKDKKWLPTI